MATATIADPTPQELRAALSHPDALYEIVDGRIIEVPGMSAYASRIARRLSIAIESIACPAGLGFTCIETMFILDVAKNLRRRPDVAFVSVERWPSDRELPTEGEFVVVPDLVVEIDSPNHLHAEVAKKTREYFRHGVRQVWIVQPETREITVQHSPKQVEIFEDGDILEGGSILPGLRVNIADLFSTAIE
jgi:Uma2 family endonuclease